MRNPFIFGDVVTGNDFADRREEISELLADLQGGLNILMYSPRRYGKTSLIMEVLTRLRGGGYLTIYIDLFRATSKTRFAEIYANAIAAGTMGKLDDIVKTIRDILPSIAPKIIVEPKGLPARIEIEFERRPKELDKTLESLYDAPQKLAERKDKTAIVVFDEFQEIRNLNGEEIERNLRSKIQFHSKVSYVFMGSRRHLLDQIFSDKNKPLYRIAKAYPLGRIPKEDFAKFINEKFSETKIKIESKDVQKILEITQGHPYHTQQLCHELWNIAQSEKIVSGQNIEEAVERVLASQSHAYITAWESIKGKQRALLLGLAIEGGKNLYSQDFIREYDLTSPSTVQKAVKALESKGLIDREDEEYKIADPFLTQWLKQRIGK